MRKKKTTLKDKVSNYAGLVILLSGTVVGFTGIIEMPDWVLKSAIITGAIAGTVVAWLQGKDGNGRTKEVRRYQ
jgi:hypothetical protein